MTATFTTRAIYRWNLSKLFCRRFYLWKGQFAQLTFYWFSHTSSGHHDQRKKVKRIFNAKKIKKKYKAKEWAIMVCFQSNQLYSISSYKYINFRFNKITLNINTKQKWWEICIEWRIKKNKMKLCNKRFRLFPTSRVNMNAEFVILKTKQQKKKKEIFKFETNNTKCHTKHRNLWWKYININMHVAIAVDVFRFNEHTLKLFLLLPTSVSLFFFFHSFWFFICVYVRFWWWQHHHKMC